MKPTGMKDDASCSVLYLVGFVLLKPVARLELCSGKMLNAYLYSCIITLNEKKKNLFLPPIHLSTTLCIFWLNLTFILSHGW
jgi:hypothetical protein